MLLDPETLDLLPEAARVRAELGERGLDAHRAARRAGRDRLAGLRHDRRGGRTSLDRRPPRAGRRRRRLGAARRRRHAPVRRPRGRADRRSQVRGARRASSPGCCRASSCSASTSTSPSAAPTARSPSTTRCAPTSPTLAALAGNAPLHGGRDTGLASIRPKLSELLPRQGVPPAFALVGGARRARALGPPRRRLPRRRRALVRAARPRRARHDRAARAGHPEHARGGGRRARVRRRAGRLTLAERHDAGERLPVHDHTRIAENRWRAMRHGLGGTLLDLDSGEPQPTRERLRRLIDAVAPAAERLGGARELEHARALAARNGAERQRALACRARAAGRRRLARRRVCAMRANVGAQTWTHGGSSNAPESGRLRSSDARQGAAPPARGLPAAVRLVRRGRRR